MTNKWRPERWGNPYQMLGWADLTRFVAQITAGKVMDRGIQQALEKAYEEGADAMMEVLAKNPDAMPEIIEKRAIARLEAIERSLPGLTFIILCLFPACRNLAEKHGYCLKHYERLNKVS